MRIAMLGWEFPPFISGGLGVHCFELTLRLARAGHQIDFYMPVSGQSIASPHSNIRLIEVAPTVLRPYLSFSKKGRLATYGESLLRAVRVYNEEAARQVAAEHARRPYDVIHSHDWLTAPGAQAAARATGRPWVATFHSTEYDRTSSPWDAILSIERQAAREADLLIAVSRRTREQLKRLGADERKIRVVYNGVDAAKFARCGPRPPLAVAAKNKRIVLFLGRLTEQKGPVQFLHAAKKVLEKNPDVLFFIAGTGEMLPLLINLSIELGLSGHVRFLGYLPEADQRRIYAASDLYVMPSTSEPFGITALEAMASGVPVIISRTSGVSEVVKSALRVDFWDINGMAQKMLAVLSYAPLHSAMVRLGPEDLRPLTWEQAAGRTAGVYGEALALRAPSPA
ncbi:MAG: glycosyltransferase family 4 protein [Candidatus Micrarchaeota archaeon]|nr:glycosyltransferase family 4 protein [Candidatus Micrarchaeota archaeon]